MTFRWTVIYFPVNQHGIRYTSKPRTGFVRARTLAHAEERAKEKFGSEVIEVR